MLQESNDSMCVKIFGVAKKANIRFTQQVLGPRCPLDLMFLQLHLLKLGL